MDTKTVQKEEISVPTPNNDTTGNAPAKTQVSIIIPVYNESSSVSQVIENVMAAPMPDNVEKELVIVDDGSTDGTTEILRDVKHHTVKIHHSMLNFGKGIAIRIGLKHAQGDIIVIQDADLEYDPVQLEKVIGPILSGKAQVVYGSRFLGKIQGMKFKYWLVNRLLVWAVFILYGVKITDEATAYKAFKADLIRDMNLQCKRFEFCPEVTAKVLRAKIPIVEIPITYEARSLEDGKKIRFMDAVEAFWTLFRYRFGRS